MNGLMSKFAKKKFQDEGPPAMGDNESRGQGGADAEDEDVMASDLTEGAGAGYHDEEAEGEGESGYGDMEDQAADMLADLAGVAPEDRKDFESALKTYVSACIAKHLGSSEDSESEDQEEEM